MISQEVRMLNRDTPSIGPSHPPNDSADFEAPPAPVTPEETPPGRMGENMPPEREGPLAQGVGAPTSDYNDDEVGGNIKGNMNVRADSTTGGAGLLEGQTDRESATISQKKAQDPEEEENEDEAEDEDEDEHDDQPDMITRRPRPSPSTEATPSGPRLPLPGAPFAPSKPTADQLIHSGTNTSTPAASNFSGIFADRFTTLSISPSADGSRDTNYLARKLLNNQLVTFTSHSERDAVNEACRLITGRGDKMTDQERAAKGPDEDHPFFRPLPESVRKGLVQSLVNGVYDPEGLLAGKEKHKQPVLNEITRMTMKNGTYLTSDSDRVLKKVRSLLPAMQAAPQRRGSAQQRQQQQGRR